MKISADKEKLVSDFILRLKRDAVKSLTDKGVQPTEELVEGFVFGVLIMLEAEGKRRNSMN